MLPETPAEARVVEQAVEPAETIHRATDHCFHIGLDADVGGDEGDGIAALVGDRLALLDLQIGDDDAGAPLPRSAARSPRPCRWHRR